MDGDVTRIGKSRPTLDPDRTLEAVRYSKCRHPRFLVDESKSEVKCQICGAMLNPIWVLRKIADAESQQAQHRDKLKALVRQLSEKLKYKCRSCGKMNDMSRIVKVKIENYRSKEPTP